MRRKDRMASGGNRVSKHAVRKGQEEEKTVVGTLLIAVWAIRRLLGLPSKHLWVAHCPSLADTRRRFLHPRAQAGGTERGAVPALGGGCADQRRDRNPATWRENCWFPHVTLRLEVWGPSSSASSSSSSSALGASDGFQSWCKVRKGHDVTSPWMRLEESS